MSLNRLVAVKMIHGGRFATSTELQRFRLEAEAAAGLEHPNIVPIYEVGEHEGHQYFSMKLVPGRSLDQQVHAFQKNPRGAVQVVTKVARAVHYAHLHGILHRDLKPANILLDPDETPLVSDFGLAKRFHDGTPLTNSKVLIGTPTYMAPEQVAGRGSGDTVAVDVYSLGAVLYELLTAKPVFVGATTLDILRQVVEAEVTFPHERCPDVDKDLETIVLKCLEKEPGRRYPSAEAFSQDLDRWLNGVPVEARPVRLPERLWKAVKRQSPSVLVSWFFAIVAGCGIFAFAAWEIFAAGSAAPAFVVGTLSIAAGVLLGLAAAQTTQRATSSPAPSERDALYGTSLLQIVANGLLLLTYYNLSMQVLDALGFQHLPNPWPQAAFAILVGAGILIVVMGIAGHFAERDSTRLAWTAPFFVLKWLLVTNLVCLLATRESLVLVEMMFFRTPYDRFPGYWVILAIALVGGLLRARSRIMVASES